MLIDSCGRRHEYLRVAVTDRCNLRCRYCMPPGGIASRPRKALASIEELERLVSVFAQLGVRKVRLTGGEPTVRQGIVELAARLHALRGIESLALTTNGVRLAELAQPLRKSGVAQLNVSLDSLQRERYADITGSDSLPAVLRGIDAALAAGYAALKINVVVMAGLNDDELAGFVELARERPLHVRFIEYMPFFGNGWSAAGCLPYREMRARIAAQFALQPLHGNGRLNGVAREYRVPGFAGSVSFITPLTAPFCSACSRLRLTADGLLQTCLFALPGADLLAALRRGAGDAELAELICSAVAGKAPSHPPAAILLAEARQAMAQIGG